MTLIFCYPVYSQRKTRVVDEQVMKYFHSSNMQKRSTRFKMPASSRSRDEAHHNIRNAPHSSLKDSLTSSVQTEINAPYRLSFNARNVVNLHIIVICCNENGLHVSYLKVTFVLISLFYVCYFNNP